MFLQPQHFQQQDCYHEARIRRYLHWLYPFCWGVRSLSINETALRNFMFEIEQCELVTWDGTIVRFQGETLPSNARIVPRSFEGTLDPGGRPLSVHLGLKRLQWEEENIYSRSALADDGSAAEKHRRFSLQEAETPDLFARDGQNTSLQYLLHEVRLFFEPDAAVQSQDYELVKIAELLRRVEGGEVQEVVLATNPTTTGEAAALHIAEQLRGAATITRLASGLPVGADLEHADEVTLSKALAGRRAVTGS